MAFSADGRLLVTGSADGTTWLWDTADRSGPAKIAALPGGGRNVGALALTPDGATLITADNGDTGTVNVWDISGARSAQHQLTRSACAAAGSGLGQDQWAALAPGVPYVPTCG